MFWPCCKYSLYSALRVAIQRGTGQDSHSGSKMLSSKALESSGVIFVLNLRALALRVSETIAPNGDSTSLSSICSAQSKKAAKAI
jgi:hypothetical protein